jgi:PIN domain nuclease of toxin-antitoxin system
MTYILDACALLALLNEELGKGYETVNDLLESAAKNETTLYIKLRFTTVIFNLKVLKLPTL